MNVEKCTITLNSKEFTSLDPTTVKELFDRGCEVQVNEMFGQSTLILIGMFVFLIVMGVLFYLSEKSDRS